MSSSSSASDIDEDDHVDGTDLADEHFSDWVEETVDSTLDLFSDATFTSPAACLEHMKAQHGIDMDDVKAKMSASSALRHCRYPSLITYLTPHTPLAVVLPKKRLE